MPYVLKGNCVHKQNEDGTAGEMVQGGCHDSHAEALAHLRALYANVKDARMKFDAEALPNIWVRAHPFGHQKKKDAHGEYFSPKTKFYDELFPSTVVNYYHSHTPDGKWAPKPILIGKTIERKYRDDGRWDLVEFFSKDKIDADVYKRVGQAIEDGTLRSSPTVVPDIHAVDKSGHITDWATGSIAVFDATEGRRPANWDAIGALEMKSMFEQVGLNFPEMKDHEGGNPNHDAQGRFARSDSTRSFVGDDEIEGLSKSELLAKFLKPGDSVSIGGIVAKVESIKGKTVVTNRGNTKLNDISSVLHPDGTNFSYDDMRRALQREKQETMKGSNMADKKQKTIEQRFVSWFKALAQNEQDDFEEIFGGDAGDETDKDSDSILNIQQQKQKEDAESIRLEYENKMKAMQDEHNKLRLENEAGKAGAWFKAQLEAGKVVPAEESAITTLYLYLNETERATHPVMKFQEAGKETEATPLDVFKRSIEQRQPILNLNENQLKFFVVKNEAQADANKKPSAERTEQLLNQSDLGRAVLAEQAKQNGKH